MEVSINYSSLVENFSLLSEPIDKFSYLIDLGKKSEGIPANLKVDENIVKVKTKDEINENNISKAKAFFRRLDNSDKENIYHHIGIYQYKVSVLEKIISLKQTDNEKKLKLEQLRALENNIDIDVVLARASPIGVDNWQDYQKVKNLLEKKINRL